MIMFRHTLFAVCALALMASSAPAFASGKSVHHTTHHASHKSGKKTKTAAPDSAPPAASTEPGK